jgi:hypothetical protein
MSTYPLGKRAFDKNLEENKRPKIKIYFLQPDGTKRLLKDEEVVEKECKYLNCSKKTTRSSSKCEDCFDRCNKLYCNNKMGKDLYYYDFCGPCTNTCENDSCGNERMKFKFSKNQKYFLHDICKECYFLRFNGCVIENCQNKSIENSYFCEKCSLLCRDCKNTKESIEFTCCITCDPEQKIKSNKILDILIK